MRFLSEYGKIIKNVRREAMDLTNDIKMANMTKEYILLHGENPPHDYITPDGYPIGAWLMGVRIAIKNGFLTNLQVLLFKTCGIDFGQPEIEKKSLLNIKDKKFREIRWESRIEEEYWKMEQKNSILKNLEEKKEEYRRAWFALVKKRFVEDERINQKILLEESVKWNQHIKNSIIEEKIKKEHIKMMKFAINKIKGAEIKKREHIKSNILFLKNTNPEEYVKNFMNCTNNRGAELFYVTKTGVIGSRIIVKDFSKKAIFRELRYYRNWYLEEYKCPITGKVLNCYLIYALTQFKTSYSSYPVISKIFLDTEYVDGKRLSGGLYCEGQDYIHLTRTETWNIIERMKVY